MGKSIRRLILFFLFFLIVNFNVLANMNVKAMYNNLLLYTPNLFAEKVFSKIDMLKWRLKVKKNYEFFKEEFKIFLKRAKLLAKNKVLKIEKLKNGLLSEKILQVDDKYYYFHPILNIVEVKKLKPFMLKNKKSKR